MVRTNFIERYGKERSAVESEIAGLQLQTRNFQYAMFNAQFSMNFFGRNIDILNIEH
jgi:hypothetical protein